MLVRGFLSAGGCLPGSLAAFGWCVFLRMVVTPFGGGDRHLRRV